MIAKSFLDYSEEQFDGLFYNILQNAKGIDNFFECMFSFFRRKTDLYMNPDTSIQKIQERFNNHKKRWQENKEREEKRKLKEDQMKREDIKRLTPTIKEITPEEAKRLKDQENNIKTNVTSKENVQPKVEPKIEVKKEEEKKDDKQQPNKANGGTANRYVWAQTLETITLDIPVDQKYKGKDIEIVFKAKHLLVRIKNGETIIDGDFSKPIKPDTFVWTLESSSNSNLKNININFEKYDCMAWWDCVIMGDTVINTEKINPEPSKLSDLEPDMRKQIDKMMFDQNQREKRIASIR